MQILKRHKTRIYMIIIILLFQVALPMLTAMVENSYALTTEEYESTKELVEVEYSDDFKAWLELSEEERKEVLIPEKYEIEGSLVGTELNVKGTEDEAELPDTFTLKDIIPENMIIRDQMNTGSCWAFGALAAVESSIALKDYFNGFVPQEYDFSERHMEYATSRYFKNNEENEYGFYRNVGDGGAFCLCIGYLTNGLGAINEEDMPFENNENTIYLSEIQGKTVTGKVIDTEKFPYRNASTVTEEDIENMKRYIMNYGAIYAGVQAGSSTKNYNTGAIYCGTDVGGGNHAVAVVGWDDNYPRTNFKSGNRPSSDGAWIIKNSAGTDSAVDGFNFVSYEDNVIYKCLHGISNASSNVDYDNIYQYDIFGPAKLYEYPSNKVYLANIFERETTDTEYLTEVSIYAGETYTCKVYVNPNGTSKSKEDLIEVELEAGETETFGVGYHTLEFKKPIELTGESFAIVIEVQTTDEETNIYLEAYDNDIYYGVTGSCYYYVEYEKGKCFYGGEAAFEGNEDEWVDFATKEADSSIKAFTTTTIKDDSLKEIVVTTAPEKDEYIEGETFDETGMIVTAVFNNGVSRELISGENAKYVIENEEVLSLQKPVTVSYTYEGVTATTEVPITVNRNKAVSLEITKEPDKVEYYEGKSFNCAGMVVTATLLDGSSKVVEDYIVVDGENLQYGQEAVTISYDGVTIELGITVIEKKLESIAITTEPKKTTYIEGQSFETEGMIITATYNSGDTEAITGYTVTDGEKLTVGKESVTISYTEDGITKTTQQNIVVEMKKLENIEITKAPEKITYIEGQNFEEEGMIVTAIYNNGDTAIVTGYTITNGDSLELGQIGVTISYTENNITKIATQNIAVESKKLESIKVTKVPSKTTYIEGDTFEDEGMEITVTYNNGDTKVVTGYTVTDGENLPAGKTSVTISYTENGITKTAVQAITVLEKLKINFEEYVEVEIGNKNYIKNIKVNTTIEQIKENITTNGEIKVYKGNAEITDSNMKTATGMTIRISLRDESEEYIVSVTGDVNGDGNINVRDILAINKHRLNKTPLTGANLLAGDITGDGETNIRDILQINKYRLGKIENL